MKTLLYTYALVKSLCSPLNVQADRKILWQKNKNMTVLSELCVSMTKLRQIFFVIAQKGLTWFAVITIQVQVPDKPCRSK